MVKAELPSHYSIGAILSKVADHLPLISSPLKAKKVFFSQEGFTLADFGSALQGVIMRRNVLDSETETMSEKMREQTSEELKAMCRANRIPRWQLGSLERKYKALVEERSLAMKNAVVPKEPQRLLPKSKVLQAIVRCSTIFISG